MCCNSHMFAVQTVNWPTVFLEEVATSALGDILNGAIAKISEDVGLPKNIGVSMEIFFYAEEVNPTAFLHQVKMPRCSMMLLNSFMFDTSLNPGAKPIVFGLSKPWMGAGRHSN